MQRLHARTDTVCIVTPYLPGVSETFIRGHIERLPTTVSLVHSWPPYLDDRPVLSLPERIVYRVQKALTGSTDSNTTAAYLAAFRRCGARAVLAEYGTTGVLTLEACQQLDLPLIVHFHGYDASVHTVLQENAEAYHRMFNECAAVVAVSRAMERRLIELGAPREKVHYNPCGIDCDAFGGADPLNAPPLFVAVGRFVEKKAPHVTIRAFALVHQVIPGARLRMVGEGALLDSCRALAEELGLTSEITFLGAQNPETVQSEMRKARCFVQHSVEAANGDCEGTPLGILEAGASGLPVVSTLHAGIPDVVNQGETGFLVDEGDVEAMAAQMLRIAQDAELAKRMGQAARKHIKERFSIQRSISGLWAIIESCIDGGKK